MLNYNLQFFAKDGPGGEKTEAATPKKLEDARKEGQVAKSREVGLGMSLLALFLILKAALGWIGESLLECFSMIYNRIPELVKLQDGMLPAAAFTAVFRNAMLRILLILAPFLIVGFIVAFVGDLIQVKWKPTMKTLSPKLSKMNPAKGLKKIISPQSLIELLKAIVKIAMIAYIVYSTLRDQAGEIFAMYDMPMMQAVAMTGNIVINLGIKISVFYMVIAGLDFLYQKWKFAEDMKMTKQEVKEEMKNSEGDPQIKGKQRQRMREASRRRMMQAVPEADVVITNPTHYAVAIKYDADAYAAPIVTAKGEDFLAQKIKETAREHHVEIVENKPLARMLYANVEIGELVPPELYQAVAEVLAMVYHAQGRA
ncbi:MAG: flagellar biosynthesis protein FlhB [Lachnospiraceae bacterium]|nr:flagellar biosynthesis protein FlhB [Lachnospiraceae bacterium]